MSRRKPLHMLLTIDDANSLFDWISSNDDVAFLWHAQNFRNKNYLRDKKVDEIINSAPRDDFGLRIRTPEDQEKLSELLLGKRWQAYYSLKCKDSAKYMLWHIPSGPIMINNYDKKGEAEIAVKNPFEVWVSPSFSGESDLPLIGYDPRFLTIDMKLCDHKNGIQCSSIYNSGTDWEKEPEEFTRFWKRVKYFINKNTTLCKANIEGYSKNLDYRA